MSMVSSTYTLLSRAPPPVAKILRTPVQQVSTAVALPRVHRKQSRARPVVCQAEGTNKVNKHNFDIDPFVLASAAVHIDPPATLPPHRDWKIMEEVVPVPVEDHGGSTPSQEQKIVKLRFHLGMDRTKENLDVSMVNDVLNIKYKKRDATEDHEASELDVQLLIPESYDKYKVKAEFNPDYGTLDVTIPKRTTEDFRRKIDIIEKKNK